MLQKKLFGRSTITTSLIVLLIYSAQIGATSQSLIVSNMQDVYTTTSSVMTPPQTNTNLLYQRVPFCVELLEDKNAICNLFGPESPECEEACFEYEFFCGGPSSRQSDVDPIRIAQGIIRLTWLRLRIEGLPDCEDRDKGIHFCQILVSSYLNLLDD